MFSKIFSLTFLAVAGVLLSARGTAAEEQVSDAQLLKAKENTIKVTRMAAQMGSISKAEAAAFENKIRAMNAAQFRAYLQEEMAQAEKQQDITGGQIDEKRLQEILQNYQNLAPGQKTPGL